MLEGLLKGLVLWLYGLILEGIENMSSALIEVFNMDLAYFEANVPVTATITQIMMAAGWALLIGNLAFQAMRAMASGLGIEGEDPEILFARTFVFSFLLMASRQICNIGLTITGRVMDLVGIPSDVTINIPKESHFSFGDSTWLVVVIIGVILIFQIIRFFFEIAERYVILATLTIMAPLAFGMGGSKSTEDIFKGWARMYGSMCVMMLMNVVFLKLLLSAMATIPSGAGVLPWLLFVVAIARVARKVDDLVCRIGLNPARTGDPLGRGLPMMLTMAAARGMGRTIAATIRGSSGAKSGSGETGGKPGKPGPSPMPTSPPPSGENQGKGPSQTSTRPDATVTASSQVQNTTKTAGQSAPTPTGQPRPADSSASKGQGSRQKGQKGGQSVPSGKQGAPKSPTNSSETTAPPPSRPPIKRKDSSNIPSQEQAAQVRLAQPIGKNQPLPPQGAALEKKDGQTSAPTRPPIQRGGNPPQERPQGTAPGKNTAVGPNETPPTTRRSDPSKRSSAPSPGGETPPSTRRNDLPQRPSTSVSGGEAPPASRRNETPQRGAASGRGDTPSVSLKISPQQSVAPGSGEAAPPATRRNSGPPKTVPLTSETPQGSRRDTPGTASAPTPTSADTRPPGTRRDSAPQATASSAPPTAPPSSGRNGTPTQPMPAKDTPQPAPRRNADPKGAAQQNPQRPSRPPLNQDRGGKP